MKLMKDRAEKFVDQLNDKEWIYNETRQKLIDLYLKFFYYDVPLKETEDTILDLFNQMKKEFEDK
jgi:hypothetical protein